MHNTNNAALENMIKRRSIRSFSSKMVNPNDLDDIIEAGLYAATGRNRQSPVIIAVTNKELRDRISAVNAEILGCSIDPFYNAPVMLIVLSDKSIPTHVYNGSLVLGNMMNAASALGLGSCWIHRAREQFERPEWIEWLKNEAGLEGEYEGIGTLAVGYIEGDYPKTLPRRPGRVVKFA